MFAVPFARLRFLAVCVAAVVLAVAVYSTPLRAADDVDTLSDRLDRLERDIRDLQLEVYKGSPPPDDRDDRPGPAPGPQSSAGGGARIADLESSLRDLRGQVEQLTFLVKQLQQQAELQRNETNYRLGALEGGAPAGSIATAPAATGAPPMATAPAGAAPHPVTPTGGPGGPTPLAPGAGSQAAGAKPGTLGTVPASAAPAGPAAADPRAQYDSAMELLSKAQYTDAQTAFRAFVAANPTNELAGPAQYWVGDISFTQKDYGGAAKAFADVLKRFPKTTKAPDAMLKLGLSLLELGQKNEGCTTLGALKAKYPTANASILGRAAQRFKEAKCT
jgi:tol-pal system protein YbgF